MKMVMRHGCIPKTGCWSRSYAYHLFNSGYGSASWVRLGGYIWSVSWGIWQWDNSIWYDFSSKCWYLGKHYSKL